MRKERWRWSVILFLMLAGLFCPVKVHAEETDSYLDGLSDEMDYGKLDTFLKDYGMEQVSFSGLVEELMQDGVSTAWGEHVFSAIKTSLVGEIAANRKMLLEIVLLAFCFSVLKNFAGAFHASYISELCFLLVYCVMAVMLLQTFPTAHKYGSEASADLKTATPPDRSPEMRSGKIPQHCSHLRQTSC